MDSKNTEVLSQLFPQDFLWGAATASYQVEGGIDNNDWAKAAREGKLPVCGKAVDHYNRFEEDFDIAKSLHHNTHRFSIEWSRIEPEEGKFNEEEIEHYRKVLQALKQRNIEPFVTLWHFTLPEWFSKKGGFGHVDAPKIFARYAQFVVERLGMEARFWMTINEPLIWASGGYLRGHWPPFQKSFFSFHSIQTQLVKAHISAYRAIKSALPHAQVGIAKHNMFFDSDGKPWNTFAAFIMKWYWNHRFLKRIEKFQDFVGLNFYICKRFGKQRECVKTEMDWDIYPLGIYHVLCELKQYKKPIYITESGLADASDTYRANYIRDYLRQVKRAIDKGVNIKGYFYWSLLDNFEWSFGFNKHFGLVSVNPETMERSVRPSAFVYKEIAEKNRV
jgi:beta-glucosidase